jgi:hypothetical protein
MEDRDGQLFGVKYETTIRVYPIYMARRSSIHELPFHSMSDRYRNTKGTIVSSAALLTIYVVREATRGRKQSIPGRESSLHSLCSIFFVTGRADEGCRQDFYTLDWKADKHRRSDEPISCFGPLRKVWVDVW